MKKRNVYILGGGTVFHVRPHLALCAPAYGKTAREINSLVHDDDVYYSQDGGCIIGEVILGLTKMATHHPFENDNIGETNKQVWNYIEEFILTDKHSPIVFLNVAFCDFDGNIIEEKRTENWEPDGFFDSSYELKTDSGKSEPRLKSSKKYKMKLTPSEKILGKIRKERKDIFLVAFKTTSGATADEQYEAGLNLLKKNSCNLVVANDIKTKRNVIIAPELAEYHEFIGNDRHDFLANLVSMTLQRASNEFSRTTVDTQEIMLDWNAAPITLKLVVDWCAEHNAYKPFNNVTVGHFGFKSEPGVLYSSRRKKNFRDNIEDRDLVRVEFSKDSQTAFGAKPSAGARSQYIVLSQYPELDCIVHFHCPLLPGSTVPVRSQREFECGSHQCGENTAAGMKLFCDGQVGAVMLDKHGPNIVFSRNTKAATIIKFIKENFDLSKSTR